MKVNVGAAQNIVRAIHAQPEPDHVYLVNIGTVAQTGNRPAPIHWGRIGDPIKISVFDTYALSKTIAESKIVDSGLRNWVSLRQTGIARFGSNEPLDPILFPRAAGWCSRMGDTRDSGMIACQFVRGFGIARNLGTHLQYRRRTTEPTYES